MSTGVQLKTPTFGEMADVYPVLAEAERFRTGGRPDERRVQSVLHALRTVLRHLGWTCDRPYTDLTPKVLDGLFVSMKARGLSPISAKSYIEGVRGLTAKWSLLRWEELGFKVEPIRLPSMYVPPNRYRELPAERKKTSWMRTRLSGTRIRRPGSSRP